MGVDPVRRLRTYVHVHPDGEPSRVFGPDDDVPAEYARLITNQKVWADDGELAADTGTEPAAVGPSAPESAGGRRPDRAVAVKMPPRGGPGSGRDAWAAYAAAHGIEVTADMRSRDDIVAALDAAGIATE